MKATYALDPVHLAVRAREEITRFSSAQRLEHLVLMVSFTTLVLTGLPQKFPTTGWAESIVWLLGGIDNTRHVHRLFAALFTLEGVYHLGYIGYILLIRRGRASMMFTLKDIADVIVQIKYYLGRSRHEPRYDRFDYRQKFEYMGVVWGGVVMVITGLIMAYPIQSTRFLPGELIPAAKEAHGGEALLAFLVIVIWHLYGAHFNPKRFPVDTVIFTGKLSRERMEEEHPVELERIEAEAERRQREAQEGKEPVVF